MSGLLLAAFLVRSAAAAPAVFEDSFDSPDFAARWDAARLPLRAAGDAPSAEVQDLVVRTPPGALRLTLLETDGPDPVGGYRAEAADRGRTAYGARARYSFSLLVPEGTELPKDQGCVLAQFHDQSTLDNPELLGSPWRHSPPLAFRLINGALKITVEREPSAQERASSDWDPARSSVRAEVGRIAPLRPGAWHDFVVEAAWDADPSRGYVRVEGAGLPGGAAVYRGAVGYAPVAGRPPPRLYFKAGPYCNSRPPPRGLTVYLDDYRRETLP